MGKLFFFFLSVVFVSHGEALEVEQILCHESETIKVLDDDLETVLFHVQNFQNVKTFQGWGVSKKEIVQNGVPVPFVRVQFSDGPGRIGWIPLRSIHSKDQCAGFDPTHTKSVTVAKEQDDPPCCQFPLPTKPNADYSSGMRRFGASRSGSRLHAACDLYKTEGSPILAIAAGTVISNLYRFYQGTYALEVKHSSGIIVRYGEVTGKAAKGISPGSKVTTGQQVGFMGKVNSGCCEPMLHFEMYSGKAKGALTSGGPYRRRSDLLDPTSYLKSWEPRVP